MQAVASPYFFFRRRNSYSSVITSRVPIRLPIIQALRNHPPARAIIGADHGFAFSSAFSYNHIFISDW
jgi:hypothetical protein